MKCKDKVMIKYTIKLNRRRKTYTIRAYDAKGNVFAKYRSTPQGAAFTEDWAQNDIRHLLKSGQCYEV